MLQTIGIEPETKERLRSLKITRGETWNDLLVRLMDKTSCYNDLILDNVKKEESPKEQNELKPTRSNIE